jgi:lipoyl(octanoyl) transferase
MSGLAEPQRPPLAVHRLGSIAYAPAVSLQEKLLEARFAQAIPDTLLLLEHAPVITLGRGAKPEHVLLSQDELERRGVELWETGRGGDVTYHGPGQLVAYAIVDLNPDRRDVRRYVSQLEEVMIRLAGVYGLSARRVSGRNGAWIDDRKIGAVGVRIRRWVTMHGFAFNATTDLNAFRAIVPCGIADKGVTSLERELGRSVAMDEVATHAAQIFATVFDRELREEAALPELPH